MSLIVHRCRCGHIDVHHDRADSCQHTRTRECRCRMAAYGPPEVVPSWRSEPVTSEAAPEPMMPPGTATTFGWFGSRPTCTCEECQALYQREMGGAA